MRLILHTANVVSDTKNCFYPNRVEVTSAEELHEAAKFDHVCAEYRKDYRSKNNFVKSNVLVMDCDNDHSEDPKDWMTCLLYTSQKDRFLRAKHRRSREIA